jgi:predicted RNA-binding Zn ribbon-like protein
MPASPAVFGGTLCLDFINTSDDAVIDESIGPSDHARLRRFRGTLRRILQGEARGTGAPAADLAYLNRILSTAGARRGLVPTVRGYGWSWLDGPAGPERLLWPIAFSAARLLEGPDLARLKTCDGCGRLFLDASHNRSRRWCDMQGCGNRAKMARYRARKD